MQKPDIVIKKYSHYVTDRNRRTYENLKKKLKDFESDTEHYERIEKQLCKTCYYINTPELQYSALWKSECIFCGIEMQGDRPNMNKLCNHCAASHNLCSSCKGFME